MPVFNSLGSNYSWAYVWRNMFASRYPKADDMVRRELGKRYGGIVTLTYKGREALELAFLRSGLPAGSAVAINGFTCYAVYEAVQNAGYRAVFADVAPKRLNFGLRELEYVHERNPDLRAVIVQNTLGLPADIAAIEEYCQKHDLLLVEDLAHSIGLDYKGGREAGTVGAFTMLSFSQDKMLDVVSGGALVDRRETAAYEETKAPHVSLLLRLKNRFYPFWAGLIRAGYKNGSGRLLHTALKSLHLLSTPMNDRLRGIHSISPVTPTLLLMKLRTLDDEIRHRRAIAAIYEKHLPKALLLQAPATKPTYIRFPVWADHREGLLKMLRAANIFVSDTWYDAPVAPVRYMPRTTYTNGLCPNAEEVVEHIVNLPTHRHIDEETALEICEVIRRWHSSKTAK